MQNLLLIFLLAGCSMKEDPYRYTKMYDRHKQKNCVVNCQFCEREKNQNKPNQTK